MIRTRDLRFRKPLGSVHNRRDAVRAGLLVRKAVGERREVSWEEMLRSC